MKQAVNSALAPLGLSVCQRTTLARAADWPRERDRHLIALREVENALRTSVLRGLPPRARRHELMTVLNGTLPTEAFHIVHYLHQAMAAGGDVCEFGVAEGTTSALLANELLDTDRALWLFDSFQGLPAPTAEDTLLHDMFKLESIENYQGTMAFPEHLVRTRLQQVGFPAERTHVIAGYLEDVLDTATLPERVCFAYVDFDFYAPIKLALETLDSRLSVGGVVLVDDYGVFSSGAAKAVDEFVAARTERYTHISPEPFARGFAMLQRHA